MVANRRASGNSSRSRRGRPARAGGYCVGCGLRWAGRSSRLRHAYRHARGTVSVWVGYVLSGVQPYPDAYGLDPGPGSYRDCHGTLVRGPRPGGRRVAG